MTKSTLSSASVVLFGTAVAAILAFSTGCEWDSSGSEGSWNDSMGWVNFSGLYRSGSSGRALVENFSASSGGADDPDDPPDDNGSNVSEYSVVGDEDTDTQPGGVSRISDVIDFENRNVAGWTLKPGSVDIVLRGTITGPVGSFKDNGAGILSGDYSQVPGGGTFTGSGTIDYDTGAWSITFSADPAEQFLEPARVTYSYVRLYDPSVEGGGGSDEGEGDGDASEGDVPPTSGAWVYTLQVAQTGNRLSFTDNRGFVWEGVISSVTTPGGDDTGRSPGDVVGTFEAKGVTDSRYKITGTLSGSYIVVTPEDGVTYGQMTSRRIQGIWIEPSGNGDLYGEASDSGQTAVTTTTTE